MNRSLQGTLIWRATHVGVRLGADAGVLNDWIVDVTRPGFRFFDGRALAPVLVMGGQKAAEVAGARAALLSAIDHGAAAPEIDALRKRYRRAQDAVFLERSELMLKQLERWLPVMHEESRGFAEKAKALLSAGSYSLRRNLEVLDVFVE